MFSSDSEGEECNDEWFWNNWNLKKKISTHLDERKIITTSSRNSRLLRTNWIPPSNFGCRYLARKQQFSESSKLSQQDMVEVKGGGKRREKSEFAECKDSLILWGARMSYGSSYANVDEGVLVWNIFHIGVFGNLKLWTDRNGDTCTYADAEIDNGFNDEKALLIVNNVQLLRKLLGVCSNEWCAFIELVSRNKSSLRYEALGKNSASKLNSLEELWRFICQRRHYLPCLAMRIRRTGAKITPYLTVLPKFTVEEIRTCDGDEIN